MNWQADLNLHWEHKSEDMLSDIVAYMCTVQHSGPTFVVVQKINEAVN